MFKHYLIASSTMSRLCGLFWPLDRTINLFFLVHYPHIFWPCQLFAYNLLPFLSERLCLYHLPYSSYSFCLFFSLTITIESCFIKQSSHALLLFCAYLNRGEKRSFCPSRHFSCVQVSMQIQPEVIRSRKQMGPRVHLTDLTTYGVS